MHVRVNFNWSTHGIGMYYDHNWVHCSAMEILYHGVALVVVQHARSLALRNDSPHQECQIHLAQRLPPICMHLNKWLNVQTAICRNGSSGIFIRTEVLLFVWLDTTGTTWGCRASHCQLSNVIHSVKGGREQSGLSSEERSYHLPIRCLISHTFTTG